MPKRKAATLLCLAMWVKLNGRMKRMKIRSTEERIMPQDSWSFQLLQASISRYVFSSQFVEGRLALDIGCGIGYGASYLKRKGANKVVGCDYSEDAITFAMARYKQEGLHFVRLDAQQLPFPTASFDVVISLEVIEHLKGWQIFPAECNRVLKEGGIFICSTPNREFSSFGRGEPLSSYHVKEFSINEFRELLSKHFEQITLYGIEPQSKRDERMQRLVVKAKSKIFSAPEAEKIINFVTKFVFRKYRLMKLEEIDEDFEKVLDKRYAAYLLQDGTLPPGTTIAVGRKSRRSYGMNVHYANTIPSSF